MCSRGKASIAIPICIDCSKSLNTDKLQLSYTGKRECDICSREIDCDTEIYNIVDVHSLLHIRKIYIKYNDELIHLNKQNAKAFIYEQSVQKL